MKEKRNSDNGFLFIEVLIAIVILGIVGIVFINSLSGFSKSSNKASVKSEEVARLSAAAEIVASTPFYPCSQGNRNPYNAIESSFSPLKIAAIYAVTKSGKWAYCQDDISGFAKTIEDSTIPWPSDENPSRIQKIVLVSPSGMLRSVIKTFDNKVGNYGLGGSFRTAIRSIADNSLITNITLEVGTTQTFKLDVINPKSTTNPILFFITQGSSNFYSTPALQASITGNVLTVTAPKYDSKNMINSVGRANLDIEAFDANASLQALPASLGMTVVIPPLRAKVMVPTITAISGVSIGQIQPIKATGLNDPFSYSLYSTPSLPTGIFYDNLTGFLSGIPTQIFSQNSYAVTVTDAVSAQATSNFQLQVVNPLTTSSLMTGKTLYTGGAITPFIPMTSSGGLSPNFVSISPDLPAGLSFNNSTGEISGTPTAYSALTEYTITISDNKIDGYVGQQISGKFNLRVLLPLTVQVDPQSANKILVSGQRASFRPVIATGGADPYTFTISPSLPNGLNFNQSTGEISGTPSSTFNSTTFTVNVVDSISPTANSGRQTFTLQIVNPLSIGSMITGRTFYKNAPITSFFPSSGSSGGVSPYVYTIQPSLPSGLTMSATTGQISGTPSVDSPLQTYTLTITDKSSSGYNSQIDSGTFNMRVLLPLSASPMYTLRIFDAGNSISGVSLVNVIGGAGPYTYSATSLPSGLFLDSTTGGLSGTPSSIAASTSYSITIRDSLGNQTSTSVSIQIVGPLVVTFKTSSATLYVNVASSITAFTATGGLSPLTYSILPNLPSGLTLNSSTGVISGTPSTKSNLTDYVLTVRDASVSGYTQKAYSQTISIRVLDKLLCVAQKSLSLSVGVSANAVTATCSGGLPGYTYKLTSGSLPSGLDIDPSTGNLIGTPTTTKSATSYSIMVNDSVTPQNNSTTYSFSLTIR